MDLSKVFGKSTAFSQRSGPPTPGPRPTPLPPRPLPPSPPPSPYNSIDFDLVIPPSAMKPSQFSRLYPDPPPSPPGGPRPGPVQPRPDQPPTPPPSPPQTMSPLILSTASGLAVLVVEYLSAISSANGENNEYERTATQGTPMLGSGLMSPGLLESSHDLAKYAKTPYIAMARYEIGPRIPLAHMIGA